MFAIVGGGGETQGAKRGVGAKRENATEEKRRQPSYCTRAGALMVS